MKKYVFLDFDGVLNTERYHSVLVNSRETCSDPYGPLFDPVAVGNLRRIVEETEAEVVICSSWKLEGADRMAEMWRSRKMPGTLAGCTPEAICGRNLLNVSLDDPDALAMLAGKGNEVKEWLGENAPRNANGCRYVILDDVPDFLPEQRDWFVQVDPEVGITERDVERAVKLLNQ